MTAKEKMTAPIASVGADVEQSSSNKLTNQSIADLPGKGNLQATNNAENTREFDTFPNEKQRISRMNAYIFLSNLLFLYRLFRLFVL